MKNCKAIFHSVNLEQIHVNAKIMNFSGMPKCFAFWHIRGLCEKSCGIFQHQEKLFAIPEENYEIIFLGREKHSKVFLRFRWKHGVLTGSRSERRVGGMENARVIPHPKGRSPEKIAPRFSWPRKF